MSNVGSFEDLIAWQKARVLTQEIYDITNAPTFYKDFSLRDQIRRAAVSVMSNIAEGHDRSSKTEFAQFLSIAKSSCAEVRSQLVVALDVGYLPPERYEHVRELTMETTRVIGGLWASIKRR